MDRVYNNGLLLLMNNSFDDYMMNEVSIPRFKGYVLIKVICPALPRASSGNYLLAAKTKGLDNLQSWH